MSIHCLKAALGVAMLPAFVLATPAQAQINGIAVAEPAVAIAGSQALQNGFQLISTTYAAQFTQVEQLNAQRVQILQTLDRNSDGQLDESEQADLTQDSPVVQQINTLDQQLQEAQAPIQMASLYVVAQVGQQYAPAVQQVINERSIQILLSPDAVDYFAPGLNVTPLVVNAINARLPSVSITPPQGWQPTEATVELFQQVQRVRALLRAQAQQQAAGAGAAQPQGEVPPR